MLKFIVKYSKLAEFDMLAHSLAQQFNRRMCPIYNKELKKLASCHRKQILGKGNI